MHGNPKLRTTGTQKLFTAGGGGPAVSDTPQGKVSPRVGVPEAPVWPFLVLVDKLGLVTMLLSASRRKVAGTVTSDFLFAYLIVE